MSHLDYSLTNARNLARRLLMASAIASSLALFASSPSYAAPAAGQNGAQKAGQNSAQAANAARPEHPHHNPLISLLPAGYDDEAAAKHVTQFLSHFVPDASDAQKTSIQNIVKAADADLKTLCQQHKATVDKEVTLLTAATVDRTAIEQNRVEGMRLAGLISQRKTQGLSDIADVLTAAQRGKLGDLLKAAAPGTPPTTPATTSATLKSPFGR